MVVSHKVEGYEEFWKVVKELESHTLYVLFSGSLNEKGESWCPDCVKGKFMVQNVHFTLFSSVCFILFVCLTSSRIVGCSR